MAKFPCRSSARFVPARFVPARCGGIIIRDGRNGGYCVRFFSSMAPGAVFGKSKVQDGERGWGSIE
jgi:hypothetical protein